MRLDKFLSHATDYSRAQVKKLIRDKRVSINGELARQADRMVSDNDVVCLDQQPVQLAGPSYLMLYKPAGYVCATTDSENPTVLDLIDTPPADLSVAGRLDKDTTGLVLLSNDGQWVHRVISPRSDCLKVYHATLDAPLTPEIVQAFASGVQLKNDDKPTLPARVSTLTDTVVSVAVSEGRYHQVRRMFAACGRHVLALHRVSIGSIMLDPAMMPGQYRALNTTEIDSMNTRQQEPS